jgi:hypothetical protein
VGLPRFKPAWIFENPRHFGRHERPEIDFDFEMTDAERAWAWYQHRVALEVHRELGHRAMTVEQFAAQLGKDQAWLTRKLHGQAPADLGEMLEWALQLGVQVLPVIDNTDDIQPTRV